MKNFKIIIYYADGNYEIRGQKLGADFLMQDMPAEVKQALDTLKNYRDSWTNEDMEKNIELEKAKEEAKKANEKLSLILTGTENSNIDIMLYAEWQTGISVDEADVYRVDNTLYMAKKDHITDTNNKPNSIEGKEFWIELGGNTEVGTTKYKKGEITLYYGVSYKALKDTDYDPGGEPEDWELVIND